MHDPSKKIEAVNLFSQVRVNLQPLAMQGAKITRTFALLALHPGQVVSAELIATEMEQESRRRNSTQALLSKLRQCGLSIGCSYAAGYSIDLQAKQVDALRFIHCVDHSNTLLKAGQFSETEAALLTAQEERAQGAFLNGIALGPVLSQWLADITERSQTLLFNLFWLQLAQGKTRQALDKLSTEWRRNPQAENLAMLLVLALYRCCQSDRIAEVFDTTKHSMALRGLYPTQLEDLVTRTVINDPSLLTPNAMPF